MLVYPGQPVGVKGVVASMRLKWLRDGVEDYDYVQILKDLGKADLALQISRSVGPDWTNWTRDSERYRVRSPETRRHHRSTDEHVSLVDAPEPVPPGTERQRSVPSRSGRQLSEAVTVREHVLRPIIPGLPDPDRG